MRPFDPNTDPSTVYRPEKGDRVQAYRGAWKSWATVWDVVDVRGTPYRGCRIEFDEPMGDPETDAEERRVLRPPWTVFPGLIDQIGNLDRLDT